MRRSQLVVLLFLGVWALSSLSVVLAKQDLYKILEVSREATQDQIKRSYRKLSLQFHPDKHPGDANAAKRFADVKRAYEVLSDPEKRQTYDLYGEEGLERENSPQRGFDPFAAFFGGGGGGGGKPKGPNMGSETEVTLEELYLGAQRNVRLTKNVICPKCRGTGAKGGQTRKCSACGGSGVRLTMQQMAPGFNVQMQSTCDVCGGRGQMAAHKCPHCSGAKVVREDKQLELVIERGMPDGHEIVFEREGEQNPDIIPGDVIIRLKTRSHPLFKRRGDDLLLEQSISLKEALTGFRRSVTHLDQHKVPIESDGIISHGQVMVIPNEGMPKFEFPSERGNLEVKFSVKMPTQLSDAQKEVIRSLLTAA